ncbi:MAG: InlB B-repeat-containing protein, partial [Actinomycetaceae bacterium]|nr:InlB B-repeat-containing protein [Actinomycetaceae bacterium]
FNGVWNAPANQATGTLCSQSNAASTLGLYGYNDNAYCLLYYAKNNADGGPVLANIPVGAHVDVFTYWGSFEYESDDTVWAPTPPTLTNFNDDIWLATYKNSSQDAEVINHWNQAGWNGSPLQEMVDNINRPIYIRDYTEYYSLYFNGNGADSGQTEAIEKKTEGTRVNLTPNGFTKEGYTFLGWATSSERATQGTVDYADEAEFVFPGQDTTLYAVWQENPPKDEHVPPPTGLSSSTDTPYLFLGIGGLLFACIIFLNYMRKRK